MQQLESLFVVQLCLWIH